MAFSERDLMKMMQRFQRFGGAMFVPVLIMPAMGLLLGVSNTLLNPDMVGDLALPGGLWHTIWKMIFDGSYVVFSNLPVLFVLGLPIGLAKKSPARAALEAFVIYMFFNVFINSLLTTNGALFGVDFSLDAGGVSGLTYIAGVKTLDTSIIGALFIAGIVIWLHERYYDAKLPDVLAIFQGSAFITILGFLAMIPMALLACWLWPNVQEGIFSLQGFLKSSGILGVGLYNFLERLLIPTGLHHFVWQPFAYGPAVVNEGALSYWYEHVSAFAASPEPMSTLFPFGGFIMFGNSKVFGVLGIAVAMIASSKKEKRKQTLGLIVPAALTAIVTGITEPFEFTFLFIAPQLFFIHAALAGTMTAVMFGLGVSGNFIFGLLDFIITWGSTWHNHWGTWLTQMAVGLGFSCIYLLLFRTIILKYNLKTPGREDADEEIKLYSKAEYREKMAARTETANTGAAANEALDDFARKAAVFLEDLGGAGNIKSLNNCATRLRVTVNDAAKVAPAAVFKQHGAHGLVLKGEAVQVVVGLSVAQIRDKMELLIK